MRTGTLDLGGIAAAARAEGRARLRESEAFEIAASLGFEIPRRTEARTSADLGRIPLEAYDGDRVVVKALSPAIIHKTESGAVAIVARDREALVEAGRAMEARLGASGIETFSVHEFVPHDRSLGSELLLGMRWSHEFGPVVVLGPGGIFTEHLTSHLREGAAVTAWSPSVGEVPDLRRDLDANVVGRILSGGVRGRPAPVSPTRLLAAVTAALEAAARWIPDALYDFEINPLVVVGGRLVALDARGRFGSGPVPLLPERPLDKMDRLFRPSTIAVAGVSERLNPGRVILNNLLREGWDPARITVIKPGTSSIAGCRCVERVADLEPPVDLLIVAIDAARAVAMIDDVLATRRAESVVLIPGGLGERAGTGDAEERLRARLAASRSEAWRGPIVTGGNCLGIRSRPSRVDAMFLPETKLPPPRGNDAPLAIVSQSGAFAASRMSRLDPLAARYVVSVGNQIDLTHGDYLAHLEADPDVEVVACYVEGFRPLDGLRWLQVAERMVRRGRTVILYRAGRTPEGAGAAASHTASIAGSWTLTRELCARAGVVLAETADDFEDLTRLFVALGRRPAAGWRLGALSNAGFECVAMADALGRFRLAPLTVATRGRLETIFRENRLDSIVSVRNPVDLSPQLADEGYAAAVRAVLEDDTVDAAVVGCVPMTPSLNTLAANPIHDEDVRRATSIGRRLAALAPSVTKPWVAVVDGGPGYDAFRSVLEEAGVPVFRTSDRALRLFETFVAARMRAAIPA